MVGFRFTGRAVALIAIAAASLAGAGHAVATPSYTLQSFARDGVQTPGTFDDINASGTIVGQQPGWPAPLVTWSGGAMTELLGGSKASAAFISALGDVAADVVDKDGNYVLVWFGGERRRVSDLANTSGINAKRQVVGAEKGYIWPGMYDNGVYKRMASLNKHGAFPTAINDQGVVVGFQRGDMGKARPAVWDADGTIRYLGSTTKVGYGQADGINNAGHIVGCTDVLHCFLYDGAKYRRLPRVDGHKVTTVKGVSDDDVVLGRVYAHTFQADVISCPGATYLLKALLGEEGTHWSEFVPTRISPSGSVIGRGIRDGESRSFVATMATPCDAAD